MSSQITYRYPCTVKYTTKTGEVHLRQSYGTRTYTYKLHRFDANEVAQMRAEIRSGRTKKDTSAMYGIGTQKLDRLLAKFPEDRTEHS